jgi:hypothetical protein
MVKVVSFCKGKKSFLTVVPMLDWISKVIHIETIFFAFIAVLFLIFIFTRDVSYLSKPLERMIRKPSLFEIDSRSLPVISPPRPPPRRPAINRTQPTSQYSKSPPAKRGKKINYHEELCRDIFEKIFRKPFPTIRPDWLENPTTGYNLELDGFCDHIQTPLGKGLAFEYDGVEHAKYSNYFQRDGVAEFEYQIVKDRWKDVQCKSRGVLLIRIPHYVTKNDLEPYIRSELQSKGVSF